VAAPASTLSSHYAMTSPPRPDLAPIRVLIVDDHPMVREGLRSMLVPAGCVVAGEAATGEHALRAVVALGPDVVLLDLELPDLDGLAVLERLKALAPGVSVLVITMHDDPALVRRAIVSGASGYVLKGVGRRELLSALEAVRYGGSVFDPSLLRATLSDTASESREATVSRPAQTTTAVALTSVEQELLRLVAQGLTNREIAERLRWSVGTVKKYLQRTLEKLDVSDRTQAAVEAVKRGLLS
jgi:DNA-binding NarL/FixJ family response regulator